MVFSGLKPPAWLLSACLVLTGAAALCDHGGAAEGDRLSDAEFARLRKALHVKNQPWATIPWKVSVTQARRLAAKERKPIFLVVNTGNCLGWT
jgi:hypothetical protein